jgi:hypothetical protein
MSRSYLQQPQRYAWTALAQIATCLVAIASCLKHRVWLLHVRLFNKHISLAAEQRHVRGNQMLSVNWRTKTKEKESITPTEKLKQYFDLAKVQRRAKKHGLDHES